MTGTKNKGMAAPSPTAGVSSSVFSAAASLFAPVDIAFLVFFRVHFAAMMLWTIWDFYHKGLIASLYIDPAFHFTYYAFSWVQPWPGDGMYVHFAALALLAVCLMVGFFTRLSAVLLWLGFTYVFLLEKAIYLNHYYLMCLLCFLFVFLPAGRCGSVDALIWPRRRSDTAPAWTLWLLRFQVALPYVYGGIAKLKADWLQGQPMQMWLSIGPMRIVLGPMAEEHWLALLFSWGGVIFDLSIVPLLLWKRTRAVAFGLVVAFHLLNAFMFDIGVFPWLMIGATTVFFPPDWPRKVITEKPARTHPRGSQSLTPGLAPKESQPRSPVKKVAIAASDVPHTPLPPLDRKQTVIVGLLLAYVVGHLVLPLRHWLYPGNVLWTEQGHMFAWHMMLRAKVNGLRFLVTDRATGKTMQVDIKRWLTQQQYQSMGDDPEMMRAFAHFLREQHERNGQDVEVRVLALCSLNGRKPQPLVNPMVDLSRQPETLFHQPWIVPLVEPFRTQPWNVPVAEWEKHLTGTQRP